MIADFTHTHTPKDSITRCQVGGLTVIEHDGAGRLPIVVVVVVAALPPCCHGHVVAMSSPCRRHVVAMSSPCRRHAVIICIYI